MADAPCWNCGERHATCHDKCDVYREWHAKLREEKEELRRQRRGAREAQSVVRRAVNKSLRGGGKKLG